MKQIYCDNGSTSFPKAPGLGEAMGTHIEMSGYNINRGGYGSAYSLGEVVLDTRERLCRLFHGENTRNVIFTGGITLALNMILGGMLDKNDHVVVSSMEHNGLLRPLVQLEQKGISFTSVAANDRGQLLPEAVEAAIQKNTKLVMVLHGSNVCGTLLPIKEIGEICKRRNVFFAVDSAQTAGTYEIDMKEADIDALAFAGHKGLLGPQGIGGFLISQRMADTMKTVILGGTGSASDQLTMPEFLPDKFEPGTLNLPGIVGLNCALSFLEKEGLDAVREKKTHLTGLFLEKLQNLDEIRLVGMPGLEGRTAVVSIDFKQIDNAEAGFLLESRFGVLTRCGLHCAPMAHKTLGTFPQGTVRFSFGYFNTEDDIRAAAEAVIKIAKGQVD